jgi:hypothetical protein
MRRVAVFLAFVVLAVALPASALAHDAPENDKSKWVMADWMLDTFFIFSGLALVVFLTAWKLGHFQDLDKAASIPLYVEEEDYYTPEWALDEEEWD